jgi:hypothetical protein
MRNQELTIPGSKWYGSWEAEGLRPAAKVLRTNWGRYLCESMLILGVFALMSVSTLGTIVLVVRTLAETMGQTG